jgi:CRP/FNR family transcriptional regulator, cyclic AMP receptor protein
LRLLVLAERGPSSKSLPEFIVSQGDLAMMVGATRQSINKELKAWQSAGIIRLERRRLSILNHDALVQIANE